MRPPPPGAPLHPLVEEVLRGQLRALRWIYAALGVLLVAIVGASWWLGPTDPGGALGPRVRLGLELGLAVVAAVLLGVALPLTRRWLLDAGRVLRADRQQLTGWGLPPEVDLVLGRQAVYLTRFTAGSVLSWGLAVSAALYGLVARLLGSGALVVGAFFALATFCLVVLAPDARRLRRALESLR